jgi:hypothetical protein
MADKYVIDAEELASLRKDASVSSAIQELANLFSGRSQDLPHRFKAPAAFSKFMADYGVNQSYYHQLPLTHDTSAPVMLQITTRPSQCILELIFSDCTGLRLFTLEIEYERKEQ